MKKKKLHLYDFILLGILLAICLTIAFNYEYFYKRYLVSILVLIKNIFFYFISIFVYDLQKPMQTLDLMLLQSGLSVTKLLPSDFIIFLEKLWSSIVMMFNGESITFYFQDFIKHLLTFLQSINLIALILPIIIIYFSRYIEADEKKKLNEQSKQLKAFIWLRDKIISPIVNFFIGLVYWFLSHKVWFLMITISFGILIGLGTVLLDAIGLYLYFFTSMDFAALWKFIVMAFIDLYAFLTRVPLIVYMLVAYLIFDKVRLNIGYQRLQAQENYNKGFIHSTGVIIGTFGPPRAGKDSLDVDMTLSLDEMYRTMCFEIIQEIDLLFPHFPWRSFEIEIERRIHSEDASLRLFNRYGIKKWIDSCKAKFEENDCPENIFGYDYKRYSYEVGNGLVKEDIWNALKDYGQAYFMYLYSNYIVSNHSISLNTVKSDKGHFPLFFYDWFKTDEMDDIPKNHAHILDFDMLRPGKKVISNNPMANVLDGSIVTISELDKERLNQFGLKSMKFEDEEANQLNDRFNWSLMLGAHPATIRFRTFFKCFYNTQRVGELSSSVNGLAETLIYISGQSKSFDCVLPMFWIEPIVCEWFINQSKSLSYSFRHNRSDSTLILYLVRTVASIFNRYMLRRMNIFGTKVLDLEVKDGSSEMAIPRKQKYFLMSKKIFSGRYTSDAYKDYFDDKFRQSSYGFVDVPSYENVTASASEFRLQNSYFLMTLDELKERLVVVDDQLIVNDNTGEIIERSLNEELDVNSIL